MVPGTVKHTVIAVREGYVMLVCPAAMSAESINKVSSELETFIRAAEPASRLDFNRALAELAAREALR